MTRPHPTEIASQAFDPDCKRCPRVHKHLQQLRGSLSDYWNKPVPPLGDPRARLLIVGLAPGRHGANRTGRPFCGDQSGDLLFSTLHQAGLSAGLKVDDLPAGMCERQGNSQVRITNALKCLPPANKPTTIELNTCQRYLSHEINQLQQGATPVVVLCLGRSAHRSVLRCCRKTLNRYPFKHGTRYWLTRELMLIDSYHCSRYNMQTCSLNRSMFQKVVDEASAVLELGQ